METVFDILKNVEAISLNNTDMGIIAQYMNRHVKIMLYDDFIQHLKSHLSLIASLAEVDGILVLYPIESKTSGHWVLLHNITPSQPEYFDPYGGRVDEPFKYTDIRPTNGTLSDLIIENGWHISINRTKFQEHMEDINTCGMHALSRLLFKSKSTDAYAKFLMPPKGQRHAMKPDKLVAMFVMPYVATHYDLNMKKK